jgi:hypothetical protein
MNRYRRTALMIGLIASMAAPALAQEAVAVGKKAPEITAEHWMNLPKGMSKLSLKELKGKVVMIEFWATW